MSDLTKSLEQIMAHIPMPEWGYDIIELAIAELGLFDKEKLTHYEAVVEAAENLSGRVAEYLVIRKDITRLSTGVPLEERLEYALKDYKKALTALEGADG